MLAIIMLKLWLARLMKTSDGQRSLVHSILPYPGHSNLLAYKLNSCNEDDERSIAIAFE